MYNVCNIKYMCMICVYIYIYLYMVYMHYPRVLSMWGIYICVHYVYMYVQSCGQVGKAKQNGITADPLQDFAESVLSLVFVGRLSTCHQIQAFKGFSFNFLNSQVFSRLVRESAHSLSSDKILFRYNCGEQKLC